MTSKHGTDGGIPIEATLIEREKQHGPFKTHARIEEALRYPMVVHGTHLTDVQRIGLGMIIHKIARILNGGHHHTDTWHDIAGYATLVEKDMNEQVES